jgi:hypothetical protein
MNTLTMKNSLLTSPDELRQEKLDVEDLIRRIMQPEKLVALNRHDKLRLCVVLSCYAGTLKKIEFEQANPLTYSPD